MASHVKQFERYIPIAAYNEIQTKLDWYKRKDDLYCILHIITKKSIFRKKELNLMYGFSNISKFEFMKYIGKDSNLVTALKTLESYGIIEVNHIYSAGSFSKGYRIKYEFVGKQIKVKMKDKNINKRIEKLEKEKLILKDIQLKFAQTDYFKTFSIDYKAAYDYIYNETLTSLLLVKYKYCLKLTENDIIDIINCEKKYQEHRLYFTLNDNVKKEYDSIMNKFCLNHHKIMCINGGYLYFNTNNTNGRLDTNLTNLPSELRRFLLSDQKLFNIDLKNSQPFFLAMAIQNETSIPKVEREFYHKLVTTGTFYDYLSYQYQIYYGKEKSYKDLKKMVFKIYYSKVHQAQKEKSFFKTLFPNILEYINNTNKGNNATLAIKLQKMESDIIIGTVLPRINKEYGFTPFTIHDSFICNQDEIERVILQIQLAFTEQYGAVPGLHVDDITSTKEDDYLFDDEYLLADFED